MASDFPLGPQALGFAPAVGGRVVLQRDAGGRAEGGADGVGELGAEEDGGAGECCVSDDLLGAHEPSVVAEVGDGIMNSLAGGFSLHPPR